jgi:hypothetical protein
VPSSHGPEVPPDAGAALAARLLAWVEDRGVVLVHDRWFPAATTFVVGEPVSGSWWAHPAANQVFDAIERLEHEVATVKLVAGKETLVARRLWPALAAIGSAREPWQVDRLDDGARAWLSRVDASDEPMVVGAADRAAAKLLEAGLLLVTGSLHTERGHHVKVVVSWARWAADRGLRWPPALPAGAARAELDEAVAAWPAPDDADGPAPRLPWHERKRAPRRGHR